MDEAFQALRAERDHWERTASRALTAGESGQRRLMDALDAVTAERDRLHARLTALLATEPIYQLERRGVGWVDRCVYCEVEHAGDGPFPHDADCAWARASEGVG